MVSDSPAPVAANQRWRRWLLPLLVLGAFALVLFVLDRELQAYHLRDVLDALHAVPTSALWSAVGITALSYWSLTIYAVLIADSCYRSSTISQYGLHVAVRTNRINRISSCQS